MKTNNKDTGSISWNLLINRLKQDFMDEGGDICNCEEVMRYSQRILKQLEVYHILKRIVKL